MNCPALALSPALNLVEIGHGGSDGSTHTILAARVSVKFAVKLGGIVLLADYIGQDIQRNASTIVLNDNPASGGELSRIMLAVKTVLADKEDTPTLIFDEIDAGISGITATVVAQKFAQISRKTQIIAVSHLAQIASMSDREFLIKKIETDGKTHTEVCELNEKNRIDEIVRLIGGNVNSASARAHAEELLQESKKYKQNLL